MNFLGLGKPKCTKCGRELKDTDAFCPGCGKPTDKGQVKCPSCGAMAPAAANFCPNCQHQLHATAPEMDQQRWFKQPADFAARVDARDLRGTFRKNLIVEAGTRAIVLVNGVNKEGELGPGTYTLDSLFSRMVGLGRADTIVAILVDVGDTPLSFTFQDVKTKDPVGIELDVQFSARLENAMQLMLNVMKGQRVVSVDMLKDYLRPQISNAVTETIARYSINDLKVNMNIKDELATAVAAHLDDTLRSIGLTIHAVQAVNFHHERWDAIGKQREDVFLQVATITADVEGREQLGALKDKQDALDLKEKEKALAKKAAEDELEIQAETLKVAKQEKLVGVIDRMLQAVSSQKKAEMGAEAEFDDFLRQLEKDKLMKDSDLEEFKRGLAERSQDHELQRSFLLRQLELQRRIELDIQELKGQDAVLEMRIARRQRELQAQLDEETRVSMHKRQATLDDQATVLAAQLAEAKNQSDIATVGFQRALSAAKTEAEIAALNREQRLAEAETDARISALEREQDELDGMMGTRILDQMKKNKMALELERMKKMREMGLSDTPGVTGVVCSRCGNESPAGSQFCKVCGVRLG